jgi:hypothetical protein
MALPASTVTRTTADDPDSALAVVAGAGIVFIQACAVIPGLLPCMLLLLPLVLPLVALGLVAAILVGVPLGLWKLLTIARRALPTRVDRPVEERRTEGDPGVSVIGRAAAR